MDLSLAVGVVPGYAVCPGTSRDGHRPAEAGLLQIIGAWAAAKRLEEFFADAERRAQDLPDEQRERTMERLRRARALIGGTDALERCRRLHQFLVIAVS